MNVYQILFLAVAAIVVYDLVMNFIRLSAETKKLRAAGKTPLVFRNGLVVILAALVETVVVFFITLLFAKLKVPASYLNVFLMFVGMYLFKNIGAYLTAWVAWSAFVKADTKKKIQQIDNDKEQAKI